MESRLILAEEANLAQAREVRHGVACCTLQLVFQSSASHTAAAALLHGIFKPRLPACASLAEMFLM